MDRVSKIKAFFASISGISRPGTQGPAGRVVGGAVVGRSVVEGSVGGCVVGSVSRGSEGFGPLGAGLVVAGGEGTTLGLVAGRGSVVPVVPMIPVAPVVLAMDGMVTVGVESVVLLLTSGNFKKLQPYRDAATIIKANTRQNLFL